MNAVKGEFYTDGKMYMRVDPTVLQVRSGMGEPGHERANDPFAVAACRNARIVGKYLDDQPPWSGLVDAAYIAGFKRIKQVEVPKHLYKILMEGV